jgi:hypothetical protein
MKITIAVTQPIIAGQSDDCKLVLIYDNITNCKLSGGSIYVGLFLFASINKILFQNKQ